MSVVGFRLAILQGKPLFIKGSYYYDLNKNGAQIRCFYGQNDIDISPNSRLQIRAQVVRRIVGVFKEETNYCIFLDIELSRRLVCTSTTVLLLTGYTLIVNGATTSSVPHCLSYTQK